ncbi:hypothetical protein D3C72_2263030 [compost metagenome]
MVNRGVRLQEILSPGGVQTDTTGCADYPLGNSLPKVIRVTNRHHHIANMRRAFTVDRNHRQPARGIDFEDCEVGQRVRANQ